MHSRLLCLILLLTVACGYSIKTEHDAVLDRTTTRMSKNIVGGVSIFGTTVSINAVKAEQSGTVTYSLLVNTISSDWIFPRSLTLRVDDSVVDFGDGLRLLADVDCSGGSCTHDERYYFSVTEQQLRDIAGAGSVLARIGGAEGYIEKEFNRANIANFADFVAKAIDGQE